MDDSDIVERLRNYNTCSDTDVDEAADEIERLRKEREKASRERDEARRLVCELAAEYKAEMFCSKGTIVPKSGRALAKAYGWDCFKENTND